LEGEGGKPTRKKKNARTALSLGNKRPSQRTGKKKEAEVPQGRSKEQKKKPGYHRFDRKKKITLYLKREREKRRGSGVAQREKSEKKQITGKTNQREKNRRPSVKEAKGGRVQGEKGEKA